MLTMKSAICALVLAFPIIGDAQHAWASDIPAKQLIRELAAEIKAGEIKRVRTLIIPDNINFITRLDPSLFRSQVVYSCDIILTIRQSNSLVLALRQTSVAEEKDMADIRVGIDFFHSPDTLRTTIYLSKRWTNTDKIDAIVGEKPVLLSTHLRDWIDKHSFPTTCGKVG